MAVIAYPSHPRLYGRSNQYSTLEAHMPQIINNMFNEMVSVSDGGHQKSAQALKLLFLPY